MNIEQMPWLMTCYNELSESIKKHNNSHAILINGEKGIGRNILAKNLAQDYLNISDFLNNGTTNSIEEESFHPDFKFIIPEEGKLNISIEKIRSTKSFLQLTSHQGIGKVVIIHPAESMTYPAMNSLLKILEEPPEDTLIILISESIKKLPQTIISRTQIQKIKNPSLKESTNWLSGYGEESWDDALNIFGCRPILLQELGHDYFNSKIKAISEDINSLALRNTKPSQVANSWKSEELDVNLSILYKWISNLIDGNLLNIKKSMPSSFEKLLQSDVDTEHCFQYLNEIATIRQYLLNGKALNWNLQISNLLVPIYSDAKGLIKNG
jgi:DNA polymerase-3 subunit delta'